VCLRVRTKIFNLWFTACTACLRKMSRSCVNEICMEIPEIILLKDQLLVGSHVWINEIFTRYSFFFRFLCFVQILHKEEKRCYCKVNYIQLVLYHIILYYIRCIKRILRYRYTTWINGMQLSCGRRHFAAVSLSLCKIGNRKAGISFYSSYVFVSIAR